MRIGIPLIAQETNTLSPILTDMETLRVNGIARGQAVLEEDLAVWQKRSKASSDRLRSNIRGFLDVVGDDDLTERSVTPIALEF